MNKKFELGITSFVEVTPDPQTGESISHPQRIREELERIIKADEVGLDFYGVGEHHREDFAASSPAIILAAAASKTKQIRLGTAVTVLSSEDPVRVYQQFSTIDAIAPGRVEIMAGRGSFTESFPLFGFSLNEYSQLFTERLNLLLNIRDNEIVYWDGETRAPIRNIGVYPRSEKPLHVSIAVGGSPESVIRAAKLRLPIVFAIIGGNPLGFKQLIDLYKHVWKESGYPEEEISIGMHSHGYIADTTELAAEEFYPSTSYVMNKLGKERGWAPYTKDSYDFARSEDGALFVGSPEHVAKKINFLKENLGITRFFLHLPLGTMDHDKVMKAIDLLGSKVAPLVKNNN